MSYIGTTEIGKMFLGDTEIEKAYLGNDLVFDSGGVTPVITPVFYTKLIFDGTAYIDTDILVPENGSIRATFGWEAQKKSQVLFNAGGRVYVNLGASTNTTSRAFVSAYDSGTSQISGTTLTLSWTYNSYSLFFTPKRLGFGNTSKTFTKGSSRPTTGLVIGQNAAHTNTPFTGTISSRIRIYGSDAQNVTQDSGFSSYTPVAQLRPCTYNGEAGLWWVEGERFFGNSAGSGTLTVSN